MNNNPEKNKKIPPGLLIILIITGTIVLLAVLFFSWFFFPVHEVSSSSLLTPHSVGYFSFNFDSKNPGIKTLKEKAKEAVLSRDISSSQKTIIKLAFSSFFPKQISGILSVDQASNKPLMTGIVGFGNEIKLISAMSGYMDKALFDNSQVLEEKEQGHTYKIQNPIEQPNEQPNEQPDEQSTLIAAYSFIGKNICVSTDATELKNSIISYKKGYAAFPRLQTMADVIAEQDNEDNDGYFFMDNSGGGLSAMIQAIEDKFTFAAFPSIDAVENMEGNLFLTPETCEGIVRFACNDREQLEVIKADVKFFYQAIRRLLKPYGLDLKGNIEIDNNSVVFDFNIKDFLNTIFTKIIKKEGEIEK